MVKHENYTIFDVDVSFALKEGDLTYGENILSDFGQVQGWTLSKPLKKGDFVELVDDEAKTVTLATGDKPVIGELISEPEWVRNSRPTEDKTYGEYRNRRATVRVYANYIKELPLGELAEDDDVTIALAEVGGEDEATEEVKVEYTIKSGDYLCYDKTKKGFVKSEENKGIIALEPKEALSTGVIKTAMGFFGDFIVKGEEGD